MTKILAIQDLIVADLISLVNLRVLQDMNLIDTQEDQVLKNQTLEEALHVDQVQEEIRQEEALHVDQVLEEVRQEDSTVRDLTNLQQEHQNLQEVGKVVLQEAQDLHLADQILDHTEVVHQEVILAQQEVLVVDHHQEVAQVLEDLQGEVESKILI